MPFSAYVRGSLRPLLQIQGLWSDRLCIQLLLLLVRNYGCDDVSVRCLYRCCVYDCGCEYILLRP